MTDSHPDLEERKAEAKRLNPLVETIGQQVKLIRRGREFVGLCPFHNEKTPSFSVSSDKDFFHCFGCGAHGDVIEFTMRSYGIEFSEALRILTGENESRPRPKVMLPVSSSVVAAPVVKPILPVPLSAPSLVGQDGWTIKLYTPKGENEKDRWKSYKPAHVFWYRNLDGEVMGAILRLEFEKEGKKKKILIPVTFCSTPDGNAVWAVNGMPSPRVLYHSEILGGCRQDGRRMRILLVEGEKKADKAQALLDGTDVLVMSWPNGSKSISYADWSILKDEDVYCWPDADETGAQALEGWRGPDGTPHPGLIDELIKVGVKSAHMVAVPEGKTDGWDIGDAVDEGWTAEQIDQHLRTGSRQVYPTQSVEERLIQASLENQNSKEAQGLAIKVDELLLVAENTPIIIMGAEFLFTLAKLFVVSSQLAIERLSVIRSKKLAIKAGHTYKIFRDELAKAERKLETASRSAGGGGRVLVPDAEEAEGAIYKALGFRKGNYYYLSPGEGEVVVLTANEHRSLNLLRLASNLYWKENFPGLKGDIDWLAAAESAMMSARAKGVFNPELLRGRGAWIDEGRTILHFGNGLIIDGEETPLTEYSGRYIYERAEALPMPDLDSPLSDEEASRIIDICCRLRWEKPYGGWLLAGWIAIAVICGALNWRPHVWLTGSSGSGKSWLLDNVIRPLIGAIAVYCQSNSTEAGIRQTLATDARPVLFDEAESEDAKAQVRIQQVLELARQSSSETGARILKGTQGQKQLGFIVRSAFLLSSIGVALRHQADQSRVTVLGLVPPSEDDQEMAVQRKEFDDLAKMVKEVITEEFASRLFARTVKQLPVIRENAKVLSRAAGKILKSQRLGDQYGSFLAGTYSLVSGERLSEEDAEKWLVNSAFAADVDDIEERDDERCLRIILHMKLRFDAGNNLRYEKTVGEMIQALKVPDSEDYLPLDQVRRQLQLNGIRVDGEWIYIANQHPALDKLLGEAANGKFANQWKLWLKRLPGARSTPKNVYFSPAVKVKATMIPFRLLAAD